VQTSSNLIRWGGLAAMAGGILGLLHSSFYAVAYFATEGGVESLEPFWVAAWAEPFRSLFEPLLILTLVVLIPGGQVLAQDVLPQRDQSLGPATRARELDDPEELEDFLDGVMSANLEGYHIPGATVAVVKDGDLFFAKGYGYADLKNRESVVADETLFRVGSVSKSFTATAVMQLVEVGKLDLNTDVNTHLEDFKIPDTHPQPKTATRGSKRAPPVTCGPWACFWSRTCRPGCARPASLPPIRTMVCRWPAT
jgi:CubicO group peptidase (beta-lactamase class C family)